MRLAQYIVIVASFASLTACSSIQVVQQSPRGGIVDLHGPTDGARAKAEEFMREQCPFGYRVLGETETSVKYACKPQGDAAPSDPEASVHEVGVRI